MSIIHDKSENFKTVMAGDDLTLVVLSAEWCGACAHFAPVLEEVVKENNTPIHKFDIDSLQEVIGDTKIEGIPTAIFIKGGKEVSRLVGSQAKDVVLGKIKEFAGE